MYTAELDGICMALDITKDISPYSVTLFADSQAAIQAVQNPRCPSGQYILEAIYRKVRALGERRTATRKHTDMVDPCACRRGWE
jgi:ribonuclease HI